MVFWDPGTARAGSQTSVQPHGTGCLPPFPTDQAWLEDVKIWGHVFSWLSPKWINSWHSLPPHLTVQSIGFVKLIPASVGLYARRAL